MAILSTFSIIRFLSLFHLAAAWFLLVSPARLINQNMIVILGEAMQIPPTRDFGKASEVTSFAGLILGLLAVTDFVATYLPQLTAVEYWTTQVPVRLLALFGITAYPLLFKAGGFLGPPASAADSALGGFATAVKHNRSPGQLIINDLVFTAGFVEVSIWFWVFIMLKDERREVAVKLAQRKKETEVLDTI